MKCQSCEKAWLSLALIEVYEGALDGEFDIKRTQTCFWCGAVYVTYVPMHELKAMMDTVREFESKHQIKIMPQGERSND